MLYANDERDQDRNHDRNQERDHDHERDLIAAVAEALGERRSLIRRHGFQMIEIVVYDDPSNLASDRSQDNDRDNYQDEYQDECPDATEDNNDSSDDFDTVDLASVGGVDWDCLDDSRLSRRRHNRRIA